jgi:hypothetical protein
MQVDTEKCPQCDYRGTKTQLSHHKRAHSKPAQNGGSDRSAAIVREVRKIARQHLADAVSGKYDVAVCKLHGEIASELFNALDPE